MDELKDENGTTQSEIYTSFNASLPPIQSAISLDGNGDGARVKIDIPRSDMQGVLDLQKLAGQTFKIVILS